MVAPIQSMTAQPNRTRRRIILGVNSLILGVLVVILGITVVGIYTRMGLKPVTLEQVTPQLQQVAWKFDREPFEGYHIQEVDMPDSNDFKKYFWVITKPTGEQATFRCIAQRWSEPSCKQSSPGPLPTPKLPASKL